MQEINEDEFEYIYEYEPEADDSCDACEQCCEPAWKGYTRHLSFGVTLFIFFLLMFMDGNYKDFHVRDAWLPILETVLTTMVIALFTSRGIEKTARIMYDKSNSSPSTSSNDSRLLRKVRKKVETSPDQEEIPDIYKNNLYTNNPNNPNNPKEE